MKSVLKKYLNTDVLLEIYAREDNTSSFVVGCVEAMDESFVLLRAFDQDGCPDGYCLRLLENVVFVQVDTLYLRCLKRLQKEADCRDASLMVPAGTELLKWLLGYAQKQGLAVSAELVSSGEMEIAGTVKMLEDELLVVDQIGNYGEDNGEAYVCLDRITAVDCDSRDERRRKRLAESLCF